MMTQPELGKIARLAKLHLPARQQDALAADMAQIIAFAKQVCDAAEGQEFDAVHTLSNALRDDTVQPSFPAEDILRGAGGGKDGCFCALPTKKEG